ncbi:CxC2 domain-containing protein [Mycena chlorophos]|uniref:CxC2 domain-containing protein n=1 Tax=Mycena chlorophos TaxID=658473 RepID=A0A8H6T1P7_MYCCL|nr:CxC2 domain-containing protein [Mycena chlorophos]
MFLRILPPKLGTMRAAFAKTSGTLYPIGGQAASRPSQPDRVEEAPVDSDADESPEVLTTSKRKQYASSTNPNLQWRPLKSAFLDEILRHEGLGDWLEAPVCAICNSAFNAPTPTPTRIFRCSDCGHFLRCLTCMKNDHCFTPLHHIEEWNGKFWSFVSLADLGLVYQLGHSGFQCPFPDNVVHSMTVIDAPFIRTLLRNSWYPATVTDPATCATFRTLQAFRLYNVVGNLNVTDFVGAMERMSDGIGASGMTRVKDRTRQMQRMARQWAFLTQLKRAGRGHDPAGIDGTPIGGCAVLCWACPHDGINIPADWRSVDPKYQFLYMVILAMDANFRMKNKIRKNEIDDPALGTGLGYWVEPGPYQEHVKKRVSETDITTCMAFAALLQKDTRMTTGLRVSGVGGCVCARHECMRPNGLGDLHKGERYCNMDWILFSAIMSLVVVSLTISYDIACQWKRNLPERIKQLPTSMQRDLSRLKMQYGLPVWHSPSHVADCQEENDLSLKPGVGKTDGEGIERFWSRLNPAAYSTKEMGLGHRADALDDRIDNHNFLKNMTLGSTLQRRLVIAREERQRQVDAFEIVSEGIEPELQLRWTDQVRQWESNNENQNPFVRQHKDCLSEAQIRLQLQHEEKQQNLNGREFVAGGSATSFITAGIQIEDAQDRLRAHIKSPYLVSATHEIKTEELRSSLSQKIARFRELQAIYMPGAAAVLAVHESARDHNALSPEPEEVILLMPSQMPRRPDYQGDGDLDAGPHGCLPGLAKIEERQRVAQCDNSLSELRGALHSKRWLIAHRNANFTGQRQTTRAAQLIQRMSRHGDGLADRYHRGHDALCGLGIVAKYPHLRVLNQSDVQLDGDSDFADLDARRKLASIGSGHGARPPRNMPRRSRRVMSWIWTAPGAFDDQEAHLHDSMRVQWTRALARKERWQEEVMLLEEEMRRVLRYLDWRERRWTSSASWRAVGDATVAAGIQALHLPLTLANISSPTLFLDKKIGVGNCEARPAPGHRDLNEQNAWMGPTRLMELSFSSSGLDLPAQGQIARVLDEFSFDPDFHPGNWMMSRSHLDDEERKRRRRESSQRYEER